MLSQWAHWDCDPPLTRAPEPDGDLAPGFSNHSVRVTAADGRAFVVRLDGVDVAGHGISRPVEWRALQLAHRAQLAPRPCYHNPELGALVCTYLPPDASQPRHSSDVAALLRRIHALPALRFRLDLAARIARYRHQCERVSPQHLAEMAPLEGLVEQALAGQRHSAEPLVLCHNDLLAANRLYSGGKLWALDWEYCAMGNRWFDLAVVCGGDDLEPEDRTALLANYLQRPPMAAEQRSLARHLLLYRYLELLWFISVDPESIDWPYKLAALDSAARDVNSS